MKKSSVSLSHIRKVFVDAHAGRESVAVEDFSLDITPGELITLLGPSGCGKTTVLRMLAGFENPTSGQILLDGKDITHLPPNERNSAMVFQSYALFPHMSVQENIVYGLKFRSATVNEKKARLDRILDAVNLRGYENRRPNELSGGQQQRVALARALIVEPAILLFDEPLSNLDAKLRESMRNEIRSLQKKLGITAVYVTHDQSEAMAIADRVVVMNKARIEQIGTPYEVYLRPRTRFVADFMGATNILAARLLSVNASDSTVEVAGSQIKVPYVLSGASASAPVHLVVRPENFRIMGNGSSEFRGEVREYHYLGSEHEYVVQLADQTVTVRAEVRPNDAPLKAGSPIGLGLKTESLHILGGG